MKTGTLRDFRKASSKWKQNHSRKFETCMWSSLPSKATISRRCLDIVLRKPDHVVRLKSFIPGCRTSDSSYTHVESKWKERESLHNFFFWFSIVCFAVSFYLMFLGLGSHLVEKLWVRRMQKVEGHRPSSMQNQLWTIQSVLHWTNVQEELTARATVRNQYKSRIYTNKRLTSLLPSSCFTRSVKFFPGLKVCKPDISTLSLGLILS